MRDEEREIGTRFAFSGEPNEHLSSSAERPSVRLQPQDVDGMILTRSRQGTRRAGRLVIYSGRLKRLISEEAEQF